MSAILKTSDATLKLPALTSDVEQGKRDMDEYGLCVHRDFITPRAGEAAEGPPGRAGRAGMRVRRRAAERQQPQRQAPGTAIPSPGTSRAGRAFPRCTTRAASSSSCWRIRCTPSTRSTCFAATSFHLSAMTGLIVRRGAEPMVVHVDQQFMPYTEVPTYLNAMLCLTEFEEVMGATRVVPQVASRPLPETGLRCEARRLQPGADRHRRGRGAGRLGDLLREPHVAPVGHVALGQDALFADHAVAAVAGSSRWTTSSRTCSDEVYRSLTPSELAAARLQGRAERSHRGASAPARARTPTARRRTCPSCAAAAARGRWRSTAWATEVGADDEAKAMGLKADGSTRSSSP